MASVLLRIKKIVVQHVIELADSSDVFCLQVFNGLAGCTYCFSSLPRSTFLPKERLSFESELKNCTVSNIAAFIRGIADTDMSYFFKIFFLLLKAV